MTGSFFAFFAASFPLLSLVPGFFEKEVQASLKPGLPRQSEPQHGKEKGSLAAATSLQVWGLVP